MNKKILLRIIAVIFILMFAICQQYSKATTLSDIVAGGETFIQKGNSSKSEDLFNADKEQDAVDQLYYILLGIAIIAAFVVGAVLGIQLIISGASGQAKVKEKLIPFAVGLFVVFGGFGIWKIALNLGNKLFEAPPTYMVSSDQAKIRIVPTNIEGTRHSMIDKDEDEVWEQKDWKVYIEDKQNLNLPIAKVEIDLVHSHEWDADDDQIFLGHVWVYAEVIKAANNYKVTYDKDRTHITIEYDGGGDVPALTTGSELCTITMGYHFGASDEDGWEGIWDGEGDLGTMTYGIEVSNIKCYDKDGNNISKNVNVSESYNEFKVEYKYRKDNLGTYAGKKAVSGAKKVKNKAKDLWDSVTPW